MEYTIRFANKNDTDDIMKFIDKFWRKNHILARDKRLFEWQYGGVDDKLHIVVGTDEDGTIQGMLGFIPYDDSDDKDIALALWKANPSTGFLGVKLIKYLMDNEPHREIVCPGINLKTTSKIYEYVGMKVDTMSQWYRLNKRGSYRIAKVEEPTIPEFIENDGFSRLVPIDTGSSLKTTCEAVFDKEIMIPYKSESYLLWRYINHPIYNYKLFSARNNKEEIKSLFVFRIQECNDSKVLRMIDCIGDENEIRNITPEIEQLMNEYECEYVDTYVAGINDDVFIDAGWCKVEETGNIIPDYFAPFEQRKVDIHYSTSNMNATLFKGDGDQDRPN